MYYANCEWYVDMGEHNKPLCERNNLRPAKCSECSIYIKSIEDENAKLRELCKGMRDAMWACATERCPHHRDGCFRVDGNGGTEPVHQGVCWFESCMRELGVEVGE